MWLLLNRIIPIGEQRLQHQFSNFQSWCKLTFLDLWEKKKKNVNYKWLHYLLECFFHGFSWHNSFILYFTWISFTDLFNSICTVQFDNWILYCYFLVGLTCICLESVRTALVEVRIYTLEKSFYLSLTDKNLRIVIHLISSMSNL